MRNETTQNTPRRRIGRRALALLLACLMAFAMLPVSAGAVEEDGGYPCGHVHEDCGYVEGEPDSCTHTCTLCAPPADDIEPEGDEIEPNSGTDPDSGTEPEVCTCGTLCTQGNIDPDCPVCSAEDADLSLCTGKRPTRRSAPRANDGTDIDMDVNGKTIYANGAPLILAAGSSDNTKTVIYIDQDGSGTITDGDEIFKPGYYADGTAEGNDLSGYTIYGGTKSQAVGSTSIIMTGGKVEIICGGGLGANVTGDTAITVTGGEVSAIFGGDNTIDHTTGSSGSGNVGSTNIAISGSTTKIEYVFGGTAGGTAGSVNITMTDGTVDSIFGGASSGTVTNDASVTISGGTVSEVYGGTPNGREINASVTIGGAAKIGKSGNGVVINSTAPDASGAIKNGVASFKIAPDLTNDVYVVLPEDYTSGTIATDAVEGDLAKIKLTGDGATDKEAYLDGSNIKVREILKPVELLDSDGNSKGSYATLADAIEAAQTGADTLKVIADIDLETTGVTISGKDLTLDLNGKTITYSGSSGSAITLDNGTYLTVTDTSDSNIGALKATGLSGTAIWNKADDACVVIEGGTVSAAGASGVAIMNNAAGRVVVEGGTVSATNGGSAIYNNSTDAVVVMGGTVSAAGSTGIAIYNKSTSRIYVEGSATVTSANTSTSSGTIYLENVPSSGNNLVTLDIKDTATVENTTDTGYAVYFKTDGTGVTASNVKNYYTVAAGATVGKVYPEPVILPTVNTTGGYSIYANGAALIIAADGDGTTVYVDMDRDGEIDDGVDKSLRALNIDNAPEDGADLSQCFVYGGCSEAILTGDTKITMTGGKVSWLFGGGKGVVNGDTSVTINGGKVNMLFGGGRNDGVVTGSTSVTVGADGTVASDVLGGGNGSESTVGTQGEATTVTVVVAGKAGTVYGGGDNSAVNSDVSVTITGTVTGNVSGGGGYGSAVNGKTAVTITGTVNGKVYGISNSTGATVSGTKTVTIGGGAKIGKSGSGVIINGGTPTAVANGVDSFKIDPSLSGANESVYVNLPAGYDTGTIATEAMESDLAKIKLTGGGATDKEAYLDGSNIKVREMLKPVELIRDGSSVGSYTTLAKAIDAAQSGDKLVITQNIDLGDTGVTISGKTLTLDLNGKTVTYSGTSSNSGAIKLENAASLTIMDDSSAGGKLTADTNGMIIHNASTGTVTVKSGTVSASGELGIAIVNGSTGAVAVEGGTVSAAGAGAYAIMNNSTGAVTITGGTVSATNGAIAVYNISTGAVNISGNSKVSAENDYAICNYKTGKITISGNAVVTSANTSNTSGTIYLNAVPSADSKTVLDIQGTATVENTATPEKYSVYFKQISVTPYNVRDYYTAAPTATLGRVHPAPAITPTVSSSFIYANGVELKIVAGTTAGYTNIRYDKNGDGTIGDDEYMKIGSEDPTEAGYDLSGYTVCGGSNNTDITANPKITMTGGKVIYIYGGGFGGDITGDTTVTVSGGEVTSVFGGGRFGAVKNTSVIVSGGKMTAVAGGGDGGDVESSANVIISGGQINHVYGGGNGNVIGAATVKITGGMVKNNVWGGGSNNNTTVGQGSSVTVGDGAKIGDEGLGIILNGGEGDDEVKNGVNNFRIDPDLTGADGSVYIRLPAGYTGGVIATDAAETDLAKITLTGPGAEGKTAEFDSVNHTIVIKTPAVPTVETIGDAQAIFANGLDFRLEAGTQTEYTKVSYRPMESDGPYTAYEVPDATGSAETGYNLYNWSIYGGSCNADVTGDTKITVTGGKVYRICGGGYGGDVSGKTTIEVGGGEVCYVFGGGSNGGEVADNTYITISGGELDAIYGGGENGTVVGTTNITMIGGKVGDSIVGSGYNGNSTGNAKIAITGGTVLGSVNGAGSDSSVTVGGGAKIGQTIFGIVINGGTGDTQVTSGVDSFRIDPDLIDEDGSIYIRLPEGIAADTVIATDAAASDLAKLALIGPGAAGKAAVFDSEQNTIVLKSAYTITFDANGGTVTPATAQTGADGRLSSLPTPTRSGSYRFDGWYTDAQRGNAVTIHTVFDADTTLYAHWTRTGGSNSSGSGSGTTTTTTTNADGSTTTTRTDKTTGTVTETTKEKDGTKTVVETQKDGAVKETVTAPDGTKTETETTASGDMTHTERRPDGTKISAESGRHGGATAAVRLPKGTDAPTVVSFPVIDGTVVLRTLPDGTEEPVVFSLVEDGRVYVRLEEDADLRVETRAGLFDDMDGHWAEEAADFTGARALFEGLAPRTFDPERPMTRAMLTTVLYRMDGMPEAGEAAFSDVDSGAWYARGVAWAAEHGIASGLSDGQFGVSREITRQELAAMLWNYAKYDGIDVSVGEDTNILSFTDIDKASEWAIPALQWACGAGILQGDRNGALNPTASATRAQVAAMLERFVSLAVK